MHRPLPVRCTNSSSRHDEAPWRASELHARLRLALDLLQLHDEHKSRASRDHLSRAAVPVRVLRGNVNLPHVALDHLLRCECGSAAAVERAIKLLAVDRNALVVAVA